MSGGRRWHLEQQLWLTRGQMFPSSSVLADRNPQDALSRLSALKATVI